jgi:hypothetical protein
MTPVGDGFMVEGRQEIHQPEHWLVPDDQLKGAIHLLDGSHLSIIWREGLLQIFRGMDALSLHSGNFRSGFNWGAIISKKLSICIQQAQTSKEGETPAFYMASYLLDVMCARNIFAGMNLSWHMSQSSWSMYISTSYGRTGTRNLTPSSAMNSSHVFISFFLRKNARDYRLWPKR